MADFDGNTIGRRSFLERAITGSTLLLPYVFNGMSLLMTPRQAQARGVPLRRLDAETSTGLERLGETILPGSAERGLVHFLDHEFDVAPNDCLLMAKYLEVPFPYGDFYAAGVHAAAAIARRDFANPIERLAPAELQSVVREMSQPGAVADRFPLFTFYLCLRSDAVDVFYGTPEGFKKLNIPYMEHIKPPEGWDG